MNVAFADIDLTNLKDIASSAKVFSLLKNRVLMLFKVRCASSNLSNVM